MPRSLSNPTVANVTKPVVKEKDRDPVAAGMRDASFNRSASFNYFLTARFEGLAPATRYEFRVVPRSLAGIQGGASFAEVFTDQ